MVLCQAMAAQFWQVRHSYEQSSTRLDYFLSGMIWTCTCPSTCGPWTAGRGRRASSGSYWSSSVTVVGRRWHLSKQPRFLSTFFYTMKIILNILIRTKQVLRRKNQTMLNSPAFTVEKKSRGYDSPDTWKIARKNRKCILLNFNKEDQFWNKVWCN